ncbi:helix-turn-helix domain-containing protein [Anaeroarcus burkinensis]|uniref:helix-turn-helix domain-containing protein n=1 Tax=Anaeroarcus burkinensis TaxID=82376 RepID=UPI000426DA8C|nr:helix-turn-helix transcriptional regulator [Anaeroarcus burkinensis]
MIGLRLRKLREDKKKLQSEVADELGLNRVTYNRYENNEREPDNENLSKLADYFGVTSDYLLGRTDIPRPVNPSTNKSASARETRQLEKLLEMDGLTFKGAPLSEDDKNKIKAALEIAFWDAKEKNKKK